MKCVYSGQILLDVFHYHWDNPVILMEKKPPRVYEIDCWINVYFPCVYLPLTLDSK